MATKRVNPKGINQYSRSIKGHRVKGQVTKSKVRKPSAKRGFSKPRSY